MRGVSCLALRMRLSPVMALLLSSATLAAPVHADDAPADAYDRAIERAHEAEEHGDWTGAARTLREIVDAYRQDHAVALELAWAYARAGDAAMAERAYRVALARAPASRDARLGLAWILAVEDRCRDALDALAPLGRDESARGVVARCEPARPVIDAWSALDAYSFRGDPTKASGLGFVAGLAAPIAPGWTLGGAYRFGAFSPPAGSAYASFVQHEGYLDAGVDRPALGLHLQGAVLDDGSGLLGTSGHVGVSGRWSPAAGDLRLDGSLSFYRDATLPRLAISWSFPVAGPLRLVPAVAAQEASGQALGNASLSLVALAPWASAWLGAKYGDEVRPAYLAAQVVYDVPSRVQWGAWAGARVRVAGPVSLFATYAYDRLQRTDALQPAANDSHALVLGARVAF